MPKISVIVPVYNTEMYLKECLESIVTQTLDDIEIICINDGSTDSSLDIVKEYAGKDGRIVVIDKQNEGVAIARNLGIDRATGEYVCFMDSDDYYPSNDILEELYNKAKGNNVLIAGGEFSAFDDKTRPYELKQNFENIDDGYLFVKDEIIEYKDYQFDYGFHRFIYDRNFLVNNNIYFPIYVRFEDPVFLVKAMYYAEKFYAVKKFTYAYRGLDKDISTKDSVIKDTFLGISDNLDFAQKYNLSKLENYTLNRFYSHYMWFVGHLNRNNKKLCKMLCKKNNSIKNFVKKQNKKNLIQNIFSLKNNKEKTHKVLTILGVKFKLKKQHKNNVINIVLSSDNNYVQHLCVTIASILKNSDNNDDYNIYILTANMDNKNKNIIKKMKKIRSFNLNFIDVDFNKFKLCPLQEICSHITKETYFRYLIPEILKDKEKVLYLDADIVVNKDIKDLYQMAFENNYAIVVEDTGFKNTQECCENLNIKKYFNAGVLLLNIPMCIKNNISQKLFLETENLYKQKKMKYQDQCVLNFVFKNKLKFIDIKYNIQSSLFYDLNSAYKKYGKNKIKKIIKRPYLIHYSAAKPWNDCSQNILGSYYWKYLKYTPYKNIWYKYVLSKFLQMIFSLKNENIKNVKYKIVTILGLKIKIRKSI